MLFDSSRENKKKIEKVTEKKENNFEECIFDFDFDLL